MGTARQLPHASEGVLQQKCLQVHLLHTINVQDPCSPSLLQYYSSVADSGHNVHSVGE